MKRFVVIAILALGFTQFSRAEEPTARLTLGFAEMGVTVTNATDEGWLNTGNDHEVPGIGGIGKVQTGIGVVRSVMYTVPPGTTNCAMSFYAYDAKIKLPIYNVAGITSGVDVVSGRFNLTNAVYSGRFRVELTQVNTNTARKAWLWGVITE